MNAKIRAGILAGGPCWSFLGGCHVTCERGRRRYANVVLVHGGFVDGSGWEGVYRH